MLVGLEKERILQGLLIIETQKKDTLRRAADFRIPNVSNMVIRINMFYTCYINRIIWKKQAGIFQWEVNNG